MRRMYMWMLPVVLAAGSLWAHDDKGKWPGDARFVQKMTMHHQMGVRMNEQCQQKATHDELKQLCEQMTRSQQDDMAQMGGIKGLTDDAKQGEGQAARSASPKGDMKPMHDKGMKMMGEMEAASGEDFEQKFLMHMSMHHEMAIKMSSRCQQNAGNDALKQLCGKMLASQQREKQQLETMLQQWYPNSGHSSHRMKGEKKDQGHGTVSPPK